MTGWFRSTPSRRSGRRADPPPPPPGGTGGSGFGGVGGAPAGPEATPSAGERRENRAVRPGASTTVAPGQGGGPAGGGAATTGQAGSARAGRRGLGDVLPRVGGGQTPEERRFAQVYAEDRVGPMPYPQQASPDIAAARARVRSLVGDLLPGGVDEGTGAALDPLIASWASGWLARIDSEHADHHAVVDRLVGGARRQLADAEASHERDRRALEIARTDYHDARERLVEPGAAADGDAGPGHPESGHPGNGRAGNGRAGHGAAPRRTAWLGRVGEGLVRRYGGAAARGPTPTAAPASPVPASGERRPAPAPRPGPDERARPSEPATRPVPVAPPSYGRTFDTSAAFPTPPTPQTPSGPTPGTAADTATDTAPEADR